MSNKNGFTLLEMLIVLVIWSVLILFVAPINFTYLEKEQEKRFLETLEFDILYIQNLSTVTKEEVELVIYKDNYAIQKGYSGRKLAVRDIPPGWDIPNRLFNTISFDGNGRIKQPGHLIIRTKHSEYKMIFPFGKGRCYVVEQ